MYRGERFNSITHLVGAVVAFVGAICLLVVARDREAWQITAFAIYGLSLFTLYFCSTMYHSLRGPAKRVFHVFDHCSIYILIAGTYTPLTLISMRGAWGCGRSSGSYGRWRSSVLRKTRCFTDAFVPSQSFCMC